MFLRLPMRRLLSALTLGAGIGLAGAAGAGLATPHIRAADVGLTSAELTVWFQDGEVCRAPMQAEGAQGMFLDCRHPVRFNVRIERQNWLQPVLGDMVAPYARIEIVAPDGRVQRFRTPRSLMPGWNDK